MERSVVAQIHGALAVGILAQSEVGVTNWPLTHPIRPLKLTCHQDLSAVRARTGRTVSKGIVVISVAFTEGIARRLTFLPTFTVQFVGVIDTSAVVGVSVKVELICVGRSGVTMGGVNVRVGNGVTVSVGDGMAVALGSSRGVSVGTMVWDGVVVAVTGRTGGGSVN